MTNRVIRHHQHSSVPTVPAYRLDEMRDAFLKVQAKHELQIRKLKAKLESRRLAIKDVRRSRDKWKQRAIKCGAWVRTRKVIT